MSKSFSDFETDLFRGILQGEAPFLGLFVDYFSDTLRSSLQEVLASKPSPLDAFLIGLERFPASFTTYLVMHLMEGFGEEGYFEVYRHLEKAIGEKIPHYRRETIWGHFRKACLQMGLSVSPRIFGSHYMVEEYLRQAGFPLVFIPELTRRMVRLARNVSLPDDDEPEAIDSWRQSLMDLLRPPFTKVGREAIGRDDQGYYVRLFIKLQRQPPSDSVVERRMQEALEQLEKLVDKGRFAVPQLLFRELQVGVLLPGGHNQTWRVQVDGATAVIRSKEHDDFFLLPSDLPKKVSIKGNGASKEFSLWEDEADNRLILFSQPSGRFLQGAALGQNDEVALKPGPYAALLRFAPEDVMHEVEQLSAEPSLFLMNLDLLPGEKLRLHRGPAQLILHAEEVPSLNWQGDIIRDVRNQEVCSSKGLFLEVVIPRELLEVQGADYILMLKPSCLGEDREIFLERADNDKTHLNIDLLGQGWKPGVARLLAELRRRDSRRVLARSSILLWNGLQYAKRSVLHCDRFPENLVKSENVRLNEPEHQLTFTDDLHRYFKMVFADGTRYHSFTWAVPGIFLSLEEFGESSWERPLKLGTTLAVTAGTRRVLKVSTTDSATLELGAFQVKVDFARVGSKLLPLASLMEYLGPGADVLALRYDGSEVKIPLVRLASPHEVFDFQVKSQSSGIEIKVAVQGEAEAFDLSAENLITGEKLTQAFQDGDIDRGLLKEWASGAGAAIYREGINALSIQLTTSGWTPGWWVLGFHAKIGGRWGALMDAQGGVYVGEMIVNDSGRIGTIADILGGLDAFNEAELEVFLTQVHKRLLPRYALQCRPHLSDLERAWNQVFQGLQETISIKSLMAWLAEQSSTDRDANWLPYHHIGAIFPQAFSYPRDRYADIENRYNTMLVDCMQILSQISDPMGALQDNLLHALGVIGGFANAALVMRGSPPKEFRLDLYRQALLGTGLSDDQKFRWDEEWQPGPGDYLGPRHYRHAVCKLEDRYLETLPGNEERLGRLITFLNNETTPLLSLYASGTSPVDLGLLDTACKVFAEPEEVQRENLQRILRFLALWAYVCRKNAREPNILERFLRDVKIRLAQPSELKGMLSYLLYVGEDVFAFYLLLWELVFTCDLDI